MKAIVKGRKQSRLVEQNGKVIEKRVFRYETSFGINSSGYEVIHDGMMTAIKEQNIWLDKEA